ncbi:MAG: hypothetical protein ABL983_01710 [Nitrospira sp.]
MMGETCCAKVCGGGGYRPYSCANKNTKLVEGEWYCGTHHPDAVKKRKEKWVERWNREQEQFNEKVKQAQRRNAIIQYLEKRQVTTVEQLMALFDGKPV